MAQNYYLTLSKFLILIFIALLSSRLLATHRVTALVLPTLYHYQCAVALDHTSAVSNRQLDESISVQRHVFQAYVPTNWQAKQFADILCTDTLVGSEYDAVSVSWQPRESITSQDILTHKWQMMWNRDHALSGLVPNWDSFYAVLLQLPSYPIYWFSQQQNIEITPSYLAGKHIGLLADSKSLSGYLAAMSQLNQHGIEVAMLTNATPPAQSSVPTIHLYPNRHELVQDFIHAKLDLIPDVGVEPILSAWPSDQKLLITDSAPMGNWYISQAMPLSLHCKLRAALTVYQPMLERVSQQPLSITGCVV